MATPNLAPHLHTEECNKIIAEYHQCVTDAGFRRYFNKCGHFQKLIRECTKKEKLQKFHNRKYHIGRIGD